MKTSIKKTLLWFVSAVLIFCGCSASPQAEQTGGKTIEYETGEFSSDDILEVHFVDVGQADGALIKFPDGQYAVIDAGDREHADDFVKYLESQGVENIAFAVATHGHEDHIGGMKNVLESFDAERVMRPDVDYDSTIYTGMLYAIEENGAEEILVKQGYSFECGGALFEVFGPVSDNYSDHNDFSVVMKMTYKDISFLFTGDAQEDAEEDILMEDCDVESDVLKVGHHGSSTSSCEEFIDNVNPEISVISLGENNDYGHPHKEILERLEKTGSRIYRTDENGTVVVLTDGTAMKIAAEKESDSSGEPEAVSPDLSSVIYIGNIKTKVYHSEKCGSLPDEKNRIMITKAEAVSEGYKAHKNCVGEDK